MALLKIVRPKMNRILALGVLAGSLIPSIAAQDSVTIKSDPSDLSRPVSTFLNQIRQHDKIAVTYEDPRYSKRDDMQGPNTTFTYSVQGLQAQDGVEVTIARMLREYAASGGLTFSVVRDGTRLDVVPNEVLDATGKRIRQGSILDTVISVPAGQRDGVQLLQAICDQIKKQAGYEIDFGPSAPVNALLRYSTTEGIDNLTAHAALARLLDRVSAPGNFVWDLYYDPADGGYGLNLHVNAASRRNPLNDANL